MSDKVFISDLHLSAEHPETASLFKRLLNERLKENDQLYILGDLFDVWVGDDDDSPFVAEIKQALRACSERGIQLFIQHGNRDFLLGKQFMRAVGALPLKNPYLTRIADEPTLLMHGDTLCIDDHAYMKTRKRLRSVLFKWFFLRKPLAMRREIAADYRQRSGENKRMTAADIMDANSDEVVRVMNRYQVTQLIHGHTHRPNMHQHTLKNGATGKRIVLDEWHGNTASLWVERNAELMQESFS